MLNGEWSKEAVCAQTDPEVFFLRGQHLNAKAVCGTCPVSKQCLTEALDDEIEFGVWGGKSGPERLEILRELKGADYKWPTVSGPLDKATCRNGLHLMEGDNVVITTEGQRCRTCRNDRNAEAQARRRAA